MDVGVLNLTRRIKRDESGVKRGLSFLFPFFSIFYYDPQTSDCVNGEEKTTPIFRKLSFQVKKKKKTRNLVLSSLRQIHRPKEVCV